MSASHKEKQQIENRLRELLSGAVSMPSTQSPEIQSAQQSTPPSSVAKDLRFIALLLAIIVCAMITGYHYQSQLHLDQLSERLYLLLHLNR